MDSTAPPPFSPERVQINIEMEVELRDAIRLLAVKHDRSFAAEMRQAVRHYIANGDGA